MSREEDAPMFGEGQKPFTPFKKKPKAEPVEILLKTHAAGFPRSDVDRAQRFADWLNGEACFIPEEERWVFWDGGSWVRDAGREIIQQVISFTDELMLEIEDIDDLKAKAAAYKLMEAARSRRAVEAVAALAQSDPKVRSNITEWDQDPWIVGVQNGVVDLKTGTFRAARPEDRVLKKLGCKFDPNAKSTQWQAFLSHILPQDGVLPFMQRALGYSLTGLTDEQVVFFLHGQGSNGKSTMIETMEHILGDYTWKANGSLFLEQRNEGDEDVKIGPLLETRFVVGSEVNENSRLAEARIKELTGGDTLHGRMRYGHPFQFKPTHKMWLYGNHKPRIAGTDNGIWRRMRLVPFSVSIPIEKRNLQLKYQLRDEASGILNWLIAGCLAWQKGGLNAPPVVMAAVEDYRSEEDTIGEFIDAECVVDPAAVTPRRDLFHAYKLWCEAAGQFAQGPRSVAERILRVPGVTTPDASVRIKGLKVRVWNGIKLADPAAFKA